MIAPREEKEKAPWTEKKKKGQARYARQKRPGRDCNIKVHKKTASVEQAGKWTARCRKGNPSLGQKRAWSDEKREGSSGRGGRKTAAVFVTTKQN